MMSTQTPPLTRAQRYALGKVAERTIGGKPTTDATYPKYATAFAHLKTQGLIELTTAGSYALMPNGAREIQSWMSSARPVSYSTLQDYIRDYNNASLYGGDS
jgi:hypothetical protein